MAPENYNLFDELHRNIYPDEHCAVVVLVAVSDEAVALSPLELSYNKQLD